MSSIDSISSSPFDFSEGILTISESPQGVSLPEESPSPPLLGAKPLHTQLQELFPSEFLNNLEIDSLSPPLETLQVLASETLKSLLSHHDTLLDHAKGIAPQHEIEEVATLLKEESRNQELLAAYRRSLVGG